MSAGLIRVGAHGFGMQRTISAGIRAARKGDVVSVTPGEYRENVVLDRTITIMAEKGTGSVRVIPQAGPALRVIAGAGMVRELTLEQQVVGAAAVLMTGGSPTLERCVVVGGHVEVGGDAEPELLDCTIRKAAGGGLRLAGDSRAIVRGGSLSSLTGPGVIVDGGAAADLSGLTITRPSGDGIRMRHAGQSCRPAWLWRAAAAARPPSGCTPACSATPGNAPAALVRAGPEFDFQVLPVGRPRHPVYPGAAFGRIAQ